MNIFSFLIFKKLVDTKYEQNIVFSRYAMFVFYSRLSHMETFFFSL